MHFLAQDIFSKFLIALDAISYKAQYPVGYYLLMIFSTRAGTCYYVAKVARPNCGFINIYRTLLHDALGVISLF